MVFTQKRVNMKNNLKANDLNRIEKRAIEALAVVPVIKAVSLKTGTDEALHILRKVNEQEAFLRGQAMARTMSGNGIEALAEEVASWGKGGDWQMDILEQTPATYFFNVLRCPYYEKYKELGIEEFGVAFSCCRDEPFARGFNPRLKLVRSTTIMEGGDCCDFRYYLQTSQRESGKHP